MLSLRVSEAVTRVETSDDTLFYATMSTSETAFVTSAVCVFSFKSINQVRLLSRERAWIRGHLHSYFSYSITASSLIRTVQAGYLCQRTWCQNIDQERYVPCHHCPSTFAFSRWFQCVSNSHSLSDSDLHFAKSHLMMAEPVSGQLLCLLHK